MAKKKSSKWMQSAVKNPGSFTAYCKRKGFGGVTDKCIEEAKAQGGTIAKKATLAQTFRKEAKKKKK